VTRAVALNLAMFTSYEESKERLMKAMPNNTGLAWFLAGWISGGLSATASLPFDNAKTKLQKQAPGPDGKLPYKNIFDAMAKEAKNNGVAGLWAGLPTYVVRIAPHVMMTLILTEKLKGLLIKK